MVPKRLLVLLYGVVVGDGGWVLDGVLWLPDVAGSGTEAKGAGAGNRPYRYVLQEGTRCTPGWVGNRRGENAPALDVTCCAHLPWHAVADLDTPAFVHAAATFGLPFAVAVLTGVDSAAAAAAAVPCVHKGLESHASRAWYCPHHGN